MRNNKKNKIMKNPTLEQVRKAFKGAKIVKCLSSDYEIDLVESEIKRDIYWFGSGYWIDYSNKQREDSVLIWDQQKGYSEIIEFKEIKLAPKKDMKNPTFEQIEEMYPDGCEVSCAAVRGDKGEVTHKSIKGNKFGFYIDSEDHEYIYLYYTPSHVFAKITKPAPESKETINFDREKIQGLDIINLKNNDLEKAIVNLIEVSRNLGLRASVTFDVR